MKVQKTPIAKDTMWRLELAENPVGQAPYWRIDVLKDDTEAEARKRMARLAGRKMDEYRAIRPKG